jgi:AcrR family transcriptional regulator
MNERKQHVIKMAHQLFVEKGFQATSIQDILDHSGISKGTFYNYFASKNELLMALFKMIYRKLEKDRNELLIGQDPSNIQIFIKQIELQFETNRTNKLISLFEEVIVSNDEELKEFIKRGQLRVLHWLFQRFIDIFGEKKKAYLLDCAIMFMGMLQFNVRYNALANGSNVSLHQIVRYSVERVVKLVDEAEKAGEQLLKPELLESWLSEHRLTDETLQQKICHIVRTFKQALNNSAEQEKYIELLDFIQDELIHSEAPRKFLIESTLSSLKASKALRGMGDFNKFEQLVGAFFSENAENSMI